MYLKNIKFICVLVFFGLVAGCGPSHYLSWQQAMNLKVKEFQGYSDQKLKPDFERAGVAYPPQDLVILILKNSKELQLYAKTNNRSDWRYIKTYPILAASGHEGPKLHAGDYQVPEGIYHIAALNPRSKFDLSMQLSYPNDFDRAQAKRDGRTELGGDIFIHGYHTSMGCIAIGNPAIRQLFPLVYRVGVANIKVIVAPKDFRKSNPRSYTGNLAWINNLYATIQENMTSLPSPRN